MTTKMDKLVADHGKIETFDPKVTPIRPATAFKIEAVNAASVTPPKPSEYLIKGVIEPGQVSLWFGPAGNGKSFLMLHLAYAIARGEPVFDRRVRGADTLFLALEGRGGIEEVARTAGPTAELAVDGERWAVGHENGVIVTGLRSGGQRRAQVHDREVGYLVFVGERLVTAAEDGRVMEWNLATDVRRELGRHDDWVSALSVSPDGRRIATASADRTVRIWSLDGAPARTLIGHARPVTALAWSTTGALASADSAGVIRIWGERDHDWAALPAGGRVRRLGWRGSELVGLVGGTLRIWSRLPPMVRHVAAGVPDATLLAVSPDGAHVAVGGRDQRVVASEVASGRIVVDRTFASPVVALTFTRPHRLVIGSNLSAELWDLDREQATMRASFATASGTESPLPLPDGERVAWIDHARSSAMIVGPDASPRLIGEGSQPNAIALRPDQRELVSAGRDGVVKAWPLDDGAGGPGRTIGATSVRLRTLAISPRSRWVVSAPQAAPVMVWPLDGGPFHELAGTRAATSWPTITADERAVIGVGPVLVVTPLAGGPDVHWRGHRADIVGTAASADGQVLASVDRDGEVRLWRAHDGASIVVGDWPAGALLRFRDDGGLAVLAADAVHLVPPSRFDETAPARPGDLTTAILDAAMAPRSPWNARGRW